MKINDAEWLAEVTAAFQRYEKALMDDDIQVMDELFRQAPETIRYGVGEMLYGYEEIAAFRRGRGGSPQRRLGAWRSPFMAITLRPPMPSFFETVRTKEGVKARLG